MSLKHVNLRMPDDLHARCVAAAKADHRSLNSWMLRVLDRYDLEPGITEMISGINQEIEFRQPEPFVPSETPGKWPIVKVSREELENHYPIAEERPRP